MKRITFLCAFALMAVFGMQAQYNYLENADGQDGGIILGDVDDDGDLDIFIFGERRGGPTQKGGLYINDGVGNFTKVECPAMPGWTGMADFGDIDGDGDLDLLFSGHKNDFVPEFSARGLALNDGTGNFSIADPADYPGFLYRSISVAFADFNNDGLLDYMLAAPDEQGHYDWELATRVDYKGKWSIFFQKADGKFEEDSQQFSNYFRDQAVSVGDYDNDGDVDIFLQGFYPHKNTEISPFGLTTNDWIAAIFQNDGTGHFTRNENTGLPSIGVGSNDWGDIDGNGFLDLIIVGDGFYNGNNNWDAAPWYNRIFSNNNGVFTQVFESPRARQFSISGSNVLQDLDNDGDLDVLFGGWADDIGRQKTFVYSNFDTDKILTSDDLVEFAMMGDAYLPGLSEQHYKVGDLNGDKILDFVYMGFKGGAEGYPPVDKRDVNIGGWTPGVNYQGMITPLVKLNAPTGLTANQVVSGDKMKVTFAWEAPANIGTKKSVTYNLALKNTATGKWLVNPMAFVGGEKDGWRKVSKMGNAYLNKTWSLTLPQGNYEWSVQAVDGGFFGGSFAPMQPLNINTGVENTNLFAPAILSAKGRMVINYNNGEQLNARVYSLSGVKLLDTQFVNEMSAPLQAGAYIVEVSGKAGNYKTKVIVR